MTRRAKGWLIASGIFAVVNLAGAVMAAVQLEAMHAATHVAFALLGAFVARQILDAREAAPVATVASLASPTEFDDRLTQLEQSLEGLATGVERVGEGQRFINHMFVEQDAPLAHGDGDRTASR